MQGDSAAPPASNGQQPAPAPEQNDNQWQYKPDDDSDETAASSDQAEPAFNPSTSQPAETEVTWTASEYIAHSKGPNWYAALALGTGLLTVVLYFWTKDLISIVAVVIMALLIGISAGRKPRVVEYRLDRAGLTMGQKFYPYSDFRAFSVVDEGAFPSIMFSPLKRFMPSLNIYYEPKDEERIIEVLAQYLPISQQAPDAIDRFARRIRF